MLREEKEIELKTALAFEEKKQAAIVGHCLQDKLFCMQAERAVRQEWFASTAMGKVFAAIMALYNKYGRVPTPPEVKGYKPFDLEDPKAQEKIYASLTEALKQSQIYKLDLLRDEMTAWMHATIFAQGFSRARDLYNSAKPSEAWQVVEDAFLLRTTCSFEDGTNQGFLPATDRLKGEREEREAESKRILPYGMAFLDEALGGMSLTDVIVLGAKTGVGKTQMAASIALTATRAGKRVHYFALEAEDREIERRVKYSFVSDAYYNDEGKKQVGKYGISYKNWRKFRIDDVLSKYEDLVEPDVQAQLKTLTSLYRNSGDFTLKSLEKNLLKIVGETDLIIIDHLHYIDTGEDENAEYKQVIKIVRDTALKYKVPIIVIAHLRKTMGSRLVPIVSNIEDFMGTSNVPKIATTCIMLGRRPNRRPKDLKQTLQAAKEFGVAEVEKLPLHLSQTFVRVVKSRLDGDVVRYTALCNFNRRTGFYENPYKLGYLVSGDSEWIPVPPDEMPDWSETAIPCSEEEGTGND